MDVTITQARSFLGTWSMRIAIVACCLALASCGQLDMEEVSSASEYSGVLGKSFRTKEELWAIGVSADKNFGKRVDYIVLVPGVGFSGPEVVSKERLGKGSTFHIVGILKASSIFSSKVVYLVQDGANRFRGIPIRIEQTGSTNDNNFGLDPSIYEGVK